jgi:hypothetical protein
VTDTPKTAEEPTANLFPCPKCHSLRLICLRHDGDWGGGDQTRLNPDACYEAGDPEDGPKELDIEVVMCLKCGAVR